MADVTVPAISSASKVARMETMVRMSFSCLGVNDIWSRAPMMPMITVEAPRSRSSLLRLWKEFSDLTGNNFT